MAGGILNLLAIGNQNILFNSNPTKTFFKVLYAKYTNFGLQKFRLDFDGNRSLRLNEPSQFQFKMKRHADMLMDTYLVVTLPHIWSPILPPVSFADQWAPYEFRWIRNIGSEIIKKISFSIGGAIIQEYTGKYLQMMVQRDQTAEKKEMFNQMTGNIVELNDPANAFGRSNVYPNAYWNPATALGAEPSIRGRTLYIPINAWFCLSSKLAFPLCALQYNELVITVELRPVAELFQVRDVRDPDNGFPYIAPDFNVAEFQMYRFLQTPPAVELRETSVYQDVRVNWNADIHLLSTYAFLSEDEVRQFASQDQEYLIKEVYQYDYYNITGANKLELKTMGMISNWMFYFQRNDVNMRNEWSNYTNWPYEFLPFDVVRAKDMVSADESNLGDVLYFENEDFVPNKGLDAFRWIGPGMNPNGTYTGYFISGPFHVENQRNILNSFGIVFDGKYRENVLDAGVFNLVEKYARTRSNLPDGVYMYSFAINADATEYQPSGAINLSKFRTVEFEMSTFAPPFDPNAEFLVICDPLTGTPIVTNKNTWRLYDYNFNMTVLEERFNTLRFVGGNASLMYVR